MTKKILKVLNWVAYYGGCYGLGFILGKIAGWLIVKLGIDAEFAEEHPWRALMVIIAVVFLAIAIPSVLIVYPLTALKTYIDEKIDDMDDPEWDE